MVVAVVVVVVVVAVVVGWFVFGVYQLCCMLVSAVVHHWGWIYRLLSIITYQQPWQPHLNASQQGVRPLLIVKIGPDLRVMFFRALGKF